MTKRLTVCLASWFTQALCFLWALIPHAVGKDDPRINDAKVITNFAPSVVVQGQNFIGEVTVRNTGTKTWSGADGTPHRLAILDDRPDFWGTGGRIELNRDFVRPNETVTFQIESRVNAVPGMYPFGWRMVEDNVEFFGEATMRPILVVATAEEAARVRRIPKYRVTTWQREEGLPQDAVRSVIQTRDGYLWVATERSVSRFDGVRFTVFDEKTRPELHNFFPYVLCEGPDDSLWIGTQSGGLFRLSHDQFTHFSQKDGLASDAVRTLATTRDGSLWIGTVEGLSLYRNGHLSVFTRTNGLGSAAVKALLDDDSGLLVATSRGVSRMSNDTLRIYLDTHEQLPTIDVRALTRAKDGSLWLGTSGGLTVIGNQMFFTRNQGLSGNLVKVVFQDTRGTLWVGTDGGLCRFSGGQWLIERNSEGIAFNDVSSILEDTEGNIWIGSKDGLHRLTEAAFTTYSTENGLSQNNVMAVRQASDGTVWVNAWGGGLNRLSNGSFTTFRKEDGLTTDLTLGLCESRDGGLWVGFDFEGGLIKWKDGKVAVRHTRETGLADGAVRVMHEDSSGRVWVGTRGGLYTLENNTITHQVISNGSLGETVRVISETSDGTIWVGWNKGLNAWREGRLIEIPAALKQLNCPVVSFYEDAEKTLWMGTLGQGLHRWKKGELTTYRSFNGLFSDDIHEILEDAQERLWFSCRNGIFRVAKKMFNDLDTGKVSSLSGRAYDKKDGLLTSECNVVAKPSAWKSRDGNLWFATAKGLSVIDPASAVEQPAALPPVRIESIISDKRLYRVIVANTKSVNVPPGRGELEIHYTALSLTAPNKNQFKHKLEGYDTEWVEAGSRRVAYYNNLRPGVYSFRVIASNCDGIWNPEGDRITVRLHPHYWQTGWFMTLAGLGTIGLVAGTARYVTKRKLQRRLLLVEQQHALEKERTRIAQDMHDDLGARLTEIAVLSTLTAKNKNQPDQVQAQMTRLSAATGEVIENLHTIVWSVNPANDTLEKLVDHLRETATTFLENSGIPCRFVAPKELPDIRLTSQTRHQLFMAVKEALNNAVKYSGATEVSLTIALDQRKLLITIADNGKGFMPDQVSGRGNGLYNMEQRMKTAGGTFSLQSMAGKGTLIELGISLRG